MTDVWSQFEVYGKALADWTMEEGITPRSAALCRDISEALLKPETFHMVADLRNVSKIQNYRSRFAEKWSELYCCMEADVAEELKRNCQTYEEFRAYADSHWFLSEYNKLIGSEIALFEQNGFDMNGLKICMIGPGALPFTGLAMVNAGAEVTLVDMYRPACEWSRMWLNRFFPDRVWNVVEAAGESFDYSEFDLVFVAGMLFNRAAVLEAIKATQPKNVLLRTTFGRRPLSLLKYQVPEEELVQLGNVEFAGESAPPLSVGCVALLYRYAS
ncbi:MAG: hypothetical protein DI585_05095 [Pseudomonas fluorescens]|nr:MAG: hypothetical protein DI585_05095 [Pseudomonas fluorescens]